MGKQLTKPHFKRIAVEVFATLLIILPMSPVFSHPWQINGAKVEAEPVDYNATHVMLQDRDGNAKSFPYTQLHESDVDYVSKLLSIRELKSREDLS